MVICSTNHQNMVKVHKYITKNHNLCQESQDFFYARLMNTKMNSLSCLLALELTNSQEKKKPILVSILVNIICNFLSESTHQ